MTRDPIDVFVRGVATVVLILIATFAINLLLEPAGVPYAQVIALGLGALVVFGGLALWHYRHMPQDSTPA